MLLEIVSLCALGEWTFVLSVYDVIDWAWIRAGSYPPPPLSSVSSSLHRQCHSHQSIEGKEIVSRIRLYLGRCRQH